MKEIEHADYVYGCKVKERDNFNTQLNKAIVEQKKLPNTYPVPMHIRAENKVNKLRNDVTERNRLMDIWGNKKNQALLRYHKLNESQNEFLA